MIALNLTANNKALEMVKEYLQQNVSNALAEKINNGVKITKDNKTLINKKDLIGFWNYASSEARKTAEKGATGAFVEDELVYGWAIHYFEEDGIEGKLYNEDGTEYKPAQKPISKPSTPQPLAKGPENKQPTLFDLLTDNQQKEEPLTEKEDKKLEIIEETKVEVFEPENIKVIERPSGNVAVDTESGTILTDEEIQSSFNRETMIILYSILDGKLELR